MSYTMHSKVPLEQTRRELRQCMFKWGVTDFDINTRNEAVELRYTLHGRTITLVMGDHEYQKDNLRVLYLAVESMRMNEVRGIDKVLETAYFQLAAPAQEKSPWEVLHIYPGSPISVAEAAYRSLAVEKHPDKGGTQAEMQEINEAIHKIRNGI
jgi:hypothetical protein